MSILALGINKKIKGFTLLELLVVMVVIGISLSLVMPNLMKTLSGLELAASTMQLVLWQKLDTILIFRLYR